MTAIEQPFGASAMDQLWYAVTILMLCPFVAVLGARLPIARVWTWFVIVPLLCVFSIPLVTTWTGSYPFPRLQIETPTTLGYLLVLVMGSGNYFGTRFTLAGMLLAAALLLLILPISTLSPVQSFTPESGRVWATILFGASAWSAFREGRRSISAANPFDRLWLDFRDYFGIVWAKRVQDRINQTAETERWPVRLELHGLTPVAGQSGDAVNTNSQKIEHAFRWLFRRFADTEWIDVRLGTASYETASAEE